MSYVMLRWILAFFSVAFAFPFGTAVIRFQRGQERAAKLLVWALRTLATVVAVAWAGFDRLTIGVLMLVIVLFSAGAWNEWRPKYHEDLEKLMFPPE